MQQQQQHFKLKININYIFSAKNNFEKYFGKKQIQNFP